MLYDNHPRGNRRSMIALGPNEPQVGPSPNLILPLLSSLLLTASRNAPPALSPSKHPRPAPATARIQAMPTQHHCFSPLPPSEPLVLRSALPTDDRSRNPLSDIYTSIPPASTALKHACACKSSPANLRLPPKRPDANAVLPSAAMHSFPLNYNKA